MILFDFTESENRTLWTPIDDVVMGGLSYSEMTSFDSGVIFSGSVSLVNNGGFASVSSVRVNFNLQGKNGIAIHARGDGKRYGFIVRSENIQSRMRYQASFDTEPDVWETIYLPFDRFRGMIFGTLIPNAPAFEATQVTSCGLIIADGQSGEFQLEIAWIAAYP